MRILTVNAGSTSWKGALVVDGVATRTFATLDDTQALPAPDAVAHRVVHGGDRIGPAVVDDGLLTALDALTELAPLHQPAGLDGIAATRRQWPGVPHVACFDTAFHATIPEAARTYAIPARFRSTVRVYGFHGLSHGWAAGRVAVHAPDARRVVVAHLGGGQSLCGVLDGRSVCTTMGFTPLDGLVMATRCGSIDPGAVLWMAAREPDAVGTVLAQESGLRGLAGTGDMREVRRRADAGDPEAVAALAVWRHRLVAALGATVATLGGIDALVLTGGIGEHDAAARASVVAGLDWLGVRTREPVRPADGVPGADDDREITAPGAPVRTFVVRSREDLRMARETATLLGGAPSGDGTYADTSR